MPKGGVGDRHLVTIPQGVVGDRLPWGGERQGGGRVPDAACTQHGYFVTPTAKVMLSFGSHASRAAHPMWMHLLGTANGHQGLRAISRIVGYCALNCAMFVRRRGVYTIGVATS